MVTRTAPPRLSARERARRAARGGGSRSVPAPLLVPALIATGFLVLPLAGLLIRAPAQADRVRRPQARAAACCEEVGRPDGRKLPKRHP